MVELLFSKYQFKIIIIDYTNSRIGFVDKEFRMDGKIVRKHPTHINI